VACEPSSDPIQLFLPIELLPLVVERHHGRGPCSRLAGLLGLGAQGQAPGGRPVAARPEDRDLLAELCVPVEVGPDLGARVEGLAAEEEATVGASQSTASAVQTAEKGNSTSSRVQRRLLWEGSK